MAKAREKWQQVNSEWLTLTFGQPPSINRAECWKLCCCKLCKSFPLAADPCWSYKNAVPSWLWPHYHRSSRPAAAVKVLAQSQPEFEAHQAQWRTLIWWVWNGWHCKERQASKSRILKMHYAKILEYKDFSYSALFFILRLVILMEYKERSPSKLSDP